MNNQTTALQDLIKSLNNLEEKETTPIVRILYAGMIGMASDLLQKEKNQIVDAHIAGQKFASDNDNPDSEEYYNQTFKSTQETV